jgi:transcriptional regulator with XRE-family HTH domain
MTNLSSILQYELKLAREFMKTEKVAAWLFKKYHEYELIQGQSVTQAQFAEYLGVAPSTFSMWINKKQPPDKASVDLIAPKLGPEIYEIMEMEPPEIISTNHLPSGVRERLERALFETKSELSLRGLSESDPEAEEIVIKIFEKYGFKYTRTIKK